jgi:hypothetical protein
LQDAIEMTARSKGTRKSLHTSNPPKNDFRNRVDAFKFIIHVILSRLQCHVPHHMHLGLLL